MKRFYRAAGVTVGFALLMMILSCGGGSSQESGSAGGVKPIKMAAIFGYTGAGSTTAGPYTQGIETMVDIINQEGGIKSLGGRPIEIVKADNQTDESLSRTIAERVLADDEIMFAVGAGSTALLLPMLPVTERLQVPILTSNSGNSITESGYKYVFRTCNQIKYINETRVNMLKWLSAEKGYNLGKIGMLYLDNDFGQSQAKGASVYYEAVGKIAVMEAYPQGISDMSSLITKLKATGIEVLDFVGDLQECKLLYDTLDAMNYHPLVVGGGSGLSQIEFAKAMGDAAIGIIGASNFTVDQSNIVKDPELMKPIENYLAKYGEYPDENGLLGMSQMFVARNALESLKELTRENLRNAISKSVTKSFYFTGPIAFDETGNNNTARWVMTQWMKNSANGKYYMGCIFPQEAGTTGLIEKK
jgi:branched-chain amino acid transport system substrate-binding protein